MPLELKVPQVGESISQVQIGQWLKEEGDAVAKDENVVELETDKATVELPSPAAGTLTRLLKKSGDSAAVGEVIGYLEEGIVEPQHPSAPPPPRDEQTQAAAAAAQAQAAKSIATAGRAQERGMPLRPGQAAVSPRREGPLQPVQARPSSAESTAIEPAAPQPSRLAPAPIAPRAGREEEVVPMSPIRRRIAERLVEAQQTAALLTTFNDVDMSAVIELRSQHKQTFADRYGVKLGFMSFFVKAAIDALKLVPQINAEIRGQDIVYHNYYDIGIAVGGGKGLVVPVLRDADRMSFAEIELAIADLAERARANALTVEELRGGTFTISNGGVYGSLLSTPIINPPQSGILGLHVIEERPVARGGQVVVRPMMYLALTYDHRIVDGQGAVTFLKRVKDVIEQPMRMLVEI
jgi:2-oxoglutarate dehydrogenase E2 component (dihydrolipoamide succinyltransferase)